jgi:DNA repair exonuclease SbcCD nuclease subunit
MRVDKDYFSVQVDKVRQILQLAKENSAIVLQPGDFFDSVDTPFFVVQYYINLFREYDVPIFCVRGQHDLRYHTRAVENTPLAVLEAAGVVNVISRFHPYWEDGVVVYGCSWGEGEMPEPGDDRTVSILILHAMVVHREPLWPGQTDYIFSHYLPRQYSGYDLFVTGDNHRHFVDGKVINCGSLMRSSIDQLNHRPVVYLYDTEQRRLKQYYLRVAPSKEVLNLGEAKEERERNEKLEAFVQSLSNVEDLGLDFLGNLSAAMQSKRVDKGTREIIREVLRDLGGDY